MFTIIENKNNCTDNFTLTEIANFYDLDYWLLLKSNLDGSSQSTLINKINGSDCYLGYSGFMKENIMNDMLFFSNNYFIISYDNGCDEMNDCDIGFGLFKIEDEKITNIYSTNKWFSNSIKWISNNEIKLMATSLELVYDEESGTETEKKKINIYTFQMTKKICNNFYQKINTLSLCVTISLIKIVYLKCEKKS